MKVAATIDETVLENDDGLEVESVMATCSRCQHSTESFGTSGDSIRRCLALLHEECPQEENNFYVSEGDE